jgi:AcrR family transcriptional regulator
MAGADGLDFDHQSIILTDGLIASTSCAFRAKSGTMPRVIKHPDLRRAEFLDTALTLFLARGYDRTSLNDVIAKSGASKGAFYYYFRSKEALLEELADRTAQHAFEALQEVARAPDVDPVSRLNALLAASRQFKLDMAAESWRVFAALFRPENESLYQRIAAAWETRFTPMLTDLIARGVRDGVFDTHDPEGVAQLLQQLVSSTYPVVSAAFRAKSNDERQAAIDVFERRLRLHGTAMDRLLGLPDGSVRIVEPGYIDAFMATLPPIPTATRTGRSRQKRD